MMLGRVLGRQLRRTQALLAVVAPAIACQSEAPAAPPHTPVGYYVEPGGTSAGNGSATRPWDLPTALAGGNGRVQPGDTIWLRGGTYGGTFTSTLRGTAAAPIVVRSYPGERAIVDGDGSGSTLKIDGAWTYFWGFEAQVSTTDRTAPRADVVYVRYASNVKLIHLVVHDGGTGIYTEAGAPEVDIYGCIVYNNGWQASASDRGHGHAIYIKNDAGTKVARDNVLFNQFGFGFHEYSDLGDGGLENIEVEGNVSFDNGALAIPGTSGAANLLVGGEEPVNNSTVVGNTTYYAPGISEKNVRIGYQSVASGSVTFNGNYAIGGEPVLEVGSWNSATVTGDTLAGTGDVVTLTDPTLQGQAWSGNRYHRDPSASAWRYAGLSYTFAGWQSATALSATDQAVPGMPNGLRVVVRPSLYEPGRAMVVVYNPSLQTSVPVDLSAVLSAGDAYEVRSVQALFGTPLANGTYGGNPVTIPMIGITPPTPIAMASSPAPVTGPAFDVFVVTRIAPAP